MLLQTRAPETAVATTYGGFIGDIRQAVHTAGTAQIDAHDVYAAIRGYERFLRTAGSHLTQLDNLTTARPAGLTPLRERLRRLPPREPGHSVWDDAAIRLAVAHDLVATHLGRGREFLTLEVADLVERGGPLVAIRDVTDLVLTATTAVRGLLHHATSERAQLADGDHSRTWLYALTDDLELQAKAVLWDFDHDLRDLPDTQMHGLRPALLIQEATPPPPSAPLEALRLLKQATYSQARGQLPTSAASLRDLAQLGVRVTTDLRSLLPQPEGSRARVEAAHLTDLLDTAELAWHEAATTIDQRVQSLTRAPAQYGAAVGHLLHAESLSLPVCTAILAALPRLGTDAATSVRRLTRQQVLLGRGRAPGRLSVSWQPLPEPEAGRLADRFAIAATTTSTAATQVRRLTTPAPAAPANPAPARHRKLDHRRALNR